MNSKAGKAPRITIAEAYRRVTEIINNDTSKRFPDSIDVYVRDAPGLDASLAAGKIPEEAEMHLEMIVGKDVAIKNLRSEFHAFCMAESVNPRPLNMPWGGPPYSGRRSDEYEYDISIEEYERWAAPFRETTTHLQLALSPGPATETGNNLEMDTGASSEITWQERARQIADTLHLRDVANGAWSSLNDLADRVSKAMVAEKKHGPQGPLSWGTVKREALQGKKWIRPKPATPEK